ncbi:hypothetical protein K6W36_14505 [Acetobacter senegalensis]|uniref:hypothetical protein n=1 Tax=Acetobacter senegalensis TaxID=446692 RepID=UPI001EDA1276|nr:hypothetical protein [Acetobacter senegalensis]MCG4252439.1 hypothetical protein [Acetobacter senegalensis]MCG4261773.1 hypothetical protein [Acetobacter senegalensis]
MCKPDNTAHPMVTDCNCPVCTAPLAASPCAWGQAMPLTSRRSVLMAGGLRTPPEPARS